MVAAQTQPRLFWKHEVEMAAIGAGVGAEWLRERFGLRLTGWYNAGETVRGAVDMILFTWKQEPIELRKDGDDREILRKALNAARS